MYEARQSVRRILKMIIRKEREIDVWLHNLDKITGNIDAIINANVLYNGEDMHSKNNDKGI